MELTLAEVVTGARRTVEMRMPIECETCDGSGGHAGHAPDPLRDVRRRGRGAPGPPLAARPDRHRRAVPDVRRHRDHHRAPVRDVPRRRPGRGHALDRGRGSRRHRRRAATASGGPGSGRAARRGSRRPLRRRPRRAQRRRSNGAATISGTGSRSRSCRPRSARRIQLETLDGARELEVQSGTQPGARLRLQGSACRRCATAGAATSSSRSTCRCPRTSRPSRPSCSCSSRSSAARTSPRRTRGFSRASGRHSGRNPIACGCPCPHDFGGRNAPDCGTRVGARFRAKDVPRVAGVKNVRLVWLVLKARGSMTFTERAGTICSAARPVP